MTPEEAYAPPRSQASEAPAKHRLGFLRGVTAIFLGSQVASFAGITFHLHGWVMGAAVLATVVACAIYARNHLLLLLALTVCAYIGCSMYSRYRIADFCASISDATLPGELPELAARAGVDWKAGKSSDESGQFYGLAADLFTMGDYACRVRFTADRVVWKQAAIH